MPKTKTTVNVDGTAEVKKEETQAPKKPRKPREKIRPMEELLEMPVTKLTDKEKDALIKELKAQRNVAIHKANQYKTSVDSAFERARDIEQKYDAMERFYLDSFKEVNLQLSAFSKAINRVTGGAH